MDGATVLSNLYRQSHFPAPPLIVRVPEPEPSMSAIKNSCSLLLHALNTSQEILV